MKRTDLGAFWAQPAVRPGVQWHGILKFEG